MIIVNQCKDEIVNFDNIVNIQEYQDEDLDTPNYIIVSVEPYVELGKYKTEERAKEVLHEIIIKYGSYLEGKIDKHLIFDIPKIYEMPQE